MREKEIPNRASNAALKPPLPSSCSQGEIRNMNTNAALELNETTGLYREGSLTSIVQRIEVDVSPHVIVDSSCSRWNEASQSG